MPKHILVAHDLSVEADVAVRRAAQLAAEHDARVSLLHVIEQPLGAPLLAKARQSAVAALQDSARSAGLVDYQPLVAEGRPASVIAATAQELQADLLVTGTHRQALVERFEGTTLEQILRCSRVPALLVTDSQLRPYQRALSALDFSVGACHAWRSACAWLAPGGELLALHAYDAGNDPARLRERLDEQRQLLEQLIHDESQQVGGPLPQLECLVSSMGVREALDHSLADWQPQLLVLGSRGRGALQQALLGSTARYYLRRPPCDLLVSA